MMLDQLDDYDWANVFGYAGETRDDNDDWINNYATPGAIPSNEEIDTSRFTRNDVSRIIASSEGENDGADWLIVGELNDGRFFSIEAGCDYTGWDCQSGGFSTVANNLNDLIRLGMSPQARKRLNLEIK